MTLEATLPIMVDRIVERCNPSLIVLFGSYACGTTHEGSDVELLVVMGDGTDRRRVAVEIRRLLGDLAVSKDIVVATPDEIASRGRVVGTVLHAALREGRVVYEQS